MTDRPVRGNRNALVILVASFAIFLNTVDISILNVAMPVIQKDLGIATTTLQWLQGAYGVPYAGFLLLAGRLADIAGRRRTFLAGVGLFGAASLAGTIAQDFTLLLAARGAQGIGAALMVPSAISLITTTFAEGAERNRALGIFAAVAATGFSSGLGAGALITEFLSWRFVFLVNVPFAAVMIVLTLLAVRGDGIVRRAPIDVAGAVLVTAGLMAVTYAITTLDGGTPGTTLAAFALGGILLAAFAWRETRSTDPLVPFALFTVPSLRAASLASFALLGSAFGFFFLVSMFLQVAAGLTPLAAGFALLPMSVVSALVSLILAPHVAGRIGARPTLALGLVLNAVGVLLFLLVARTNPLPMTIAASVVLGGFGMGLGYPASNLVALAGVEREFQGAASGIQNASLQAGGAAGTAIAATVLSASRAPLANLTVSDQGATKLAASVILAAFALLGALALVRSRRTARQTCPCEPSAA